MRKHLAVVLSFAVTMAPTVEPAALVMAGEPEDPPSISADIERFLSVEAYSIPTIVVGESYASIESRKIREEEERAKAAEEARKASERKKKAEIPSAAYVPKNDIQAKAREMVAAAWDDSQWPHFVFLVGKESGWNPTAQNPRSTAYGIMQFLDGTWKGTGCVKTSDAVEQIRCGIIYIKNRYQTPKEAALFHKKYGYY
jgi:hypothetical protein